MTELLTPIEAAGRLRMGEKTLRELRKQGRIRYVALSARKIAYRPEDCDEYIEAQTKRDEPCDTKPQSKRQPARSGTVIPFSKIFG